ncbi:MAG: glycosyl hydrolase [Saprospiraceae bacterium]|nr:glycosyl hydrolase [Saprospiraceae bacterium]
MRFTHLMVLFLLTICSGLLQAQKNNKAVDTPVKKDSLKNTDLSGLRFRSIGPAITGGRIVDLAVNPKNTSEFYVASGHGSLWKTTNHGTTFSPAFEGQTSFAIGAVRLDPNNPNVVWVGTGEHNSQTNVIYGDGIYRSEDGGASWTNMGLKNSEHIGGIVIDPANSNIVYVAAYGALRNEGGDRGIFKTTDGGKTWKNTLNISKYTGCFEVHMDPRYSNILYASAHQRMGKGNTVVTGGNESAVYRSTDSGETWQRMMKGMPSESIGRIGLAISPANADIVYALVQAKEGSGLFKSVNRGVSWSKQGPYNSAYPFYMQKLVADPKDENKIYSMDLLNQVSYDGGKTFKPLGEKYKHVDNHAMWIDPNDTRHMLSGNDGGLYETWDMGQNWDFKGNIPIAEIYKVSTDNATPFYNVYIGTQDNNSLMGPSRTLSSYGISNREWTFTLGGDGFETQADWKDSDILYAQSQNGGLVRYDKKTGEQLFIQPVSPVDTGYRFDWDSPLLISNHDNSRLYFAANKLFRTNDKGNSWEVISPDLTRGVPQKMQRLMDRSWSIDEMAAKRSFANITTIAESPLDPNMIYVGTGDGLIQVTNDGGKTWKKATSIPGINDWTRIHHLVASRHDKMVAYAACHALTSGDYRPFLFKTTDGGKTWTSISANLPERGNTFCLAEDHVKAGLLFAGTQFGLYVSVDGGKEWIKFMNGLPTSTYMDIDIQRGESDLVVSTFGRGVYILDDYSPLRSLTNETIPQKATLFPIKDALMYVESSPFGFAGKGFQGANFYAASNPPVGVTFTYFVKEELKSLKQKRRDEEKAKQEKGEDIEYPKYDVLAKEAEQQDAYLLFVISDKQGNIIRKLKTGISKGLNRLTWDFRYQPFKPVNFEAFDDTYAWNSPDIGFMIVPGTYEVTVQQFDGEQFTELIPATSFECLPLNHATIPVVDQRSLDGFNRKVAELSRVLNGADAYRSELADKVKHYRKAVLDAADVAPEIALEINAIHKKLTDLNKKMNGDGLRTRYEGASPVSIHDRVDQITGALWSTTAAPTQTFMNSYEVAASQVEGVLASLRAITMEIEKMDARLESAKVPYTPGRLPVWNKN